MADPASFGNHERDVDQALIALKKGTQLIKYSRKGKPKFCPFRLSTDESTLVWYSRGEERNLKLASISKIIPGQRTAVFRRYLRPEKDYLSFSLLYNNGERSLDLICKDKVEAEVWFVGLKALTSTGQRKRSKSDLDGGLYSDDGGESAHILRPFGSALESPSSVSPTRDTRAAVDIGGSRKHSLPSSDVGSDRANMHVRASTGDGFRLSVSSAAPSCTSTGSGPDDCESLGDVYVWGEVWCEGSLADGSLNSFCSKTDVLLPKPLESNVVLDVHQIACGVGHAALVTRQGEVFTWGEESGGRLGHGIDADVSRPYLVESLAVCNVDYVACGEYHTCALSVSGDLFTWGDGTHNAGLLGHGTNISHWIPKRVSGPLEGMQVLSIACGTWHTALATSTGKLFTFGDGTFGVLGHGDRESISYPREVESLSGLKTIRVACGVWHTAAIVEVMGHYGANISSRKLFTWGDGDKNRLGHGDKETRLVPTCVSSLIDYNFHQLACGHSITVALTTSGHVFTMGSTVYGQLGNPQSDGKVPCLVQDRLVGELVEEIACGAYHVAVLTSRSEVFTWGKGANGRLGHGDVEDRKTPAVIEALKDRHVKSIACGSNFTASICIHKWVSSADQSLCSGCRQAFGFTRKRHNCYNCGLVHCHACSSRKALRAALAPTPGKPHRVCDSCYIKLKASEAGGYSTVRKKMFVPRRPSDYKERVDRGEIRSSRILSSPIVDPSRHLEVRSVKHGMKSDSFCLLQPAQVPSLPALQTSLRPVVTSIPQSASSSRPASPYSRRPSPPRSVTPVYTKSIIDSLKKTNELLNQEVLKLHAEVKRLRQRCEDQDVELHKSEKKAQAAALLAAEESSKRNVAKEVMKSLAAQLKDIAEKVPPEGYDSSDIKAMHGQVESLLTPDGNHALEFSSTASVTDCSEPGQRHLHDNPPMINEGAANTDNHSMDDPGDGTGITELSQNADEGSLQHTNRPSVSDTGEAMSHHSMENGSRSPKSTVREGEFQHNEQFEPGVYITYIALRNGTKVFKRVRFSKRKFAEQQAEGWWKENQERVFKKYVAPENVASGTPASAPPSEEDAVTPSSQPEPH